jgi:hypothetical protein
LRNGIHFISGLPRTGSTLLAALSPEEKVICRVRRIPRVLDSIERLLRQNRWELSKLFDFDAGGTVYSRVDGLASRNGIVGFALNALKQAMHSNESARLLLPPYETLAREPAHALHAVYEFTGLPAFQHDFENITFDATEFDARLGTPGLHTVRPRAAAVERRDPTARPVAPLRTREHLARPDVRYTWSAGGVMARGGTRVSPALASSPAAMTVANSPGGKPLNPRRSVNRFFGSLSAGRGR